MTDPTMKICENTEFGSGLLSESVVGTGADGNPKMFMNHTDYPYTWPFQPFDPSEQFTIKVGKLDKSVKIDPIYTDQTLYSQLTDMKKVYDKPEAAKKLSYNRDHIAINPFGSLPELYRNRAGMKLANINGLWPLLGDWDVTFARKKGIRYGTRGGDFKRAFQSAGLRFLDIGGAPGGFIEYINSRVAGANGVSFSLTGGTSLIWNQTLVKQMGSRFVIDNGTSGNGDIFKNWRHWGKKYKSSFDIVTADIGFPTTDWERKEYVIQRAVLHELWVGTVCLKPGGNLVVKCMDLVTNGSMEMLEIFSKCFKYIAIIKPVTSRPTNEEKYIVLMDRLDDNVVDMITTRLVPLLTKMNKTATDKVHSYIQSFRDGTKVNPQFGEWLSNVNSSILGNEYMMTSFLIQAINTGDPKAFLDRLIMDGVVKTYDISKALTVWCVGDTPGTGF